MNLQETVKATGESGGVSAAICRRQQARTDMTEADRLIISIDRPRVTTKRLWRISQYSTA